MIAALGLALLLQAAPAANGAASLQVRVSPERPAVGEPISIELRVRAPQGTQVRFPVLPDTGTRIEPLDPRSISTGSASDAVELVATYRVIAWDTGSVAPAFGDVTLVHEGRVTRFPVELGGLRIRSVLPMDTSARQPKPARAPLEAPSMPWRWVVGAAVAAVLAGWGWRRFRRRREGRSAADPGAFDRAQAALAHLRALDLSSVGEAGRHALAHGQVLRRYVAERWPALSVALTAQELAARLPGTEFPVMPERFVALMVALEPLAYAAAPISSGEAERLALESSTLLADLERAWVERHRREQEATRVRRKKLR